MSPPEVVDRRDTPFGELVLRRDGDHFEVISDGVFLMDTRNGESERRLVSEAMATAESARSVLIGGLGVGFSLDEALREPDVELVTVVELHRTVVDWNRVHLRTAGLDDPRTRIVVTDLVAFLDTADDRFDVICLDVDNGPDWLVHKGNAALYSSDGVDRLAAVLTPTGVVAIWSAMAAPTLTDRLRERFASVRAVPVPVPRGEPDVVLLAHDAR